MKNQIPLSAEYLSNTIYIYMYVCMCIILYINNTLPFVVDLVFYI